MNKITLDYQDQNQIKATSYWQLFKELFYISAFTFGGGYVMLPLMRSKFVHKLHWIDEQEIINLFAIAQSAPGVMAINASIMVGYRLKGYRGALVAIVATILPPLCLITVLSYFYLAFSQNKLVAAALRGMQAGVAAVILDVIVTMLQTILKQKWLPAIFMMVASFIAVYFFKVNMMVMIVLAICLGICMSFNTTRARKGGATK